jgi:hypothetical protein
VPPSANNLPPHLPRGVYLHGGLKRGRPVLFVVDRHGETRAERAVPLNWDLYDAWDALTEWLEKHDPSPVRLVKPAPPTVARGPLTREQLLDAMTPAQRVIAFGPASRPSRTPYPSRG